MRRLRNGEPDFGFRPSETIPTTRRRMRPRFISSLFWLVALPAALYLAIWMYGLPGLKWTYSYRGKHETRIETECWFLTLDGPKKYSPGVYEDRCPIIKLFPTRQLPFPF